MSRRYQEPKPPRHKVEIVDGVEQIRVNARRSLFVLLFLGVWLAMWSVGGPLALTTLIEDFSWFLLIWLCGWALGWLVAAAVIAWQLTGAETLRVVGGDLEIGHEMLGFSRSRLYRGSEIRGLAATGPPDFFRHFQLSVPFPGFGGWGSVKFHYGARTYHAASGLDEAEGRMIAEHLRRRLPASASDG